MLENLSERLCSKVIFRGSSGGSIPARRRSASASWWRTSSKSCRCGFSTPKPKLLSGLSEISFGVASRPAAVMACAQNSLILAIFILKSVAHTDAESKKSLPARVDVVFFESVSSQHVLEGRPEWLPCLAAHHLWEGVGDGVDKRCSTRCVAIAPPSCDGFKAHKVPVKGWVFLAIPCALCVEEVCSETSCVSFPQSIVHFSCKSACLRG